MTNMYPKPPANPNGAQPVGQGYNVIPEQFNSPLKYGAVSSNRPPEQLYRIEPQYAANPQFQAPQTFKSGGPIVPQSYVTSSKQVRTFGYIALAIGGMLVFVLLGLASLFLGAAGGITTVLLALIPLTAIIFATIWIGRWDPEPAGVRVLAFVWGAAFSVLGTFALGGIWTAILGSDMFIDASIQAPIIEELMKGVGLLAIALFFRKYIDGPVDGIVYMMLIAAGFAFTENILYFADSLTSTGVVGLGMTFVMRGVLSPFAHALFSLPMGIALGLAVRKDAKSLGTIGFFFLAYPISVFLHFLWNGSTFFVAGNTWFLFYGLIQVPLFIGGVVIIAWFRNHEALRTYKYLTQYAWAGWFSPQEVETLGTWKGRRYALRWAKSRGESTRILAKTLNKEVVDLAGVREHLAQGKVTPNRLSREQELLAKISHDKKLLVTS